jgi:tetratricopeptide (TPR) repeat protein
MRHFRKIDKALCLVLSFTMLTLFNSCSHRDDKENLHEKKLRNILIRGNDSLRINPFSSISILDEVITQTTDSTTYHKAIITKGKAYFLLGKFDSAMLLERKALAYFQTNQLSDSTKELLSDCYNSLGNIYSRLSKSDSAIVFYEKAIQHNIPTRVPDILINIADQYKFKGNYAMSASMLRKALFICDSLGVEKMKFPVNFALADVYLSLHDYKLADQYYLLAEKELNDRSVNEKLVFYNNRGNYYYYTGNYARSKEWFLKVKDLAEKTKNEFSVNLCYINLSDIYLHLDKIDSAKHYVDKSEKYFASLTFKAGIYYANTIKLGIAMKCKNFNEINSLKGEFSDNEPEVDPNLVSIRNKFLEQIAVEQGNYASAYYYLNKNQQLNDSLRNDITLKRMEELDFRYRQDTLVLSKEIYINRQNSEVQSLRLSIYFWILVSVSGLLISLVVYLGIKKRHNQQRITYLEQITRFKMTNIRNRISPHFLFNVLNNEIQNMDEEKKEHLFTLVHLLRKSLELAEQVSIPMSDEVEFTKAFIELEKHKLGDNYSIVWDVDPKIDLQKTRMIPLMIQIPVENSIKHGLGQLNREKLLTISIKQEENGILIEIADNGRGIRHTYETQSKGTGTGLRVINQTIEILNSRNSEKIAFSIRNREKESTEGCIAEIYLPINYKFEYK